MTAASAHRRAAPASRALAALGLPRPPSTPPTPPRTPSPTAARWRTEIPSVRGARGAGRRPQGGLAARRADPPDQPGQRRVDAHRRRDHRDGGVPAPSATSSSACSPARAAPGTSAPPTRTDSGGAGLRARGHDAVAGCVEDAVRAAELGVKCLLVADEGVLWTLHRARVAGVIPADTTFKVSALIGPVNPASYAVYENARRRLDQRPLRPDARPPHRDPPGLRRPHGHVHRGPRRPRRLCADVRGRRADPARRTAST